MRVHTPEQLSRQNLELVTQVAGRRRKVDLQATAEHFLERGSESPLHL